MLICRVVAVWLLLLAGGCASGPGDRTVLTPIEARVDVVAGRRLILPVEVEGPLLTGPVDARLEDGRRPRASLVWISVGQDTAAQGWLPPAGVWMVTPATSGSRPSAAGVWTVVVDLPADAFGQGVWLHGRRVALAWVADPAASTVDWSPVYGGEVRSASGLAQLLEPERLSPARRWRWRLLMDGLDPRAGVPPLPDDVLEALAGQTEARWAAALARLGLLDEQLAREVRRALAMLVDFGGVSAPAWPATGQDLDGLLADLLNPGLADDRLAERVRAWLDSRPRAVAWVVDDAAGERGFGAIGMANLGTNGALAGVAPDDGSSPADLVTVGPGEAVMLRTPPLAGGPAAHIRARLGGWERMLELATPAAAEPPGLRLDPLIADWTMESWLGDAPVRGQAAAMMLYRRGDEGGSERWSIYLEATAAPGAAGDDVVRIWLGPGGAPTAVLRISGDGSMVDESQGAGRPAEAMPVSRRSDGRWSCRVDIPGRCIGADGLLLIGVEHRDGLGRRSAWPRAMLPWQTEPGRTAVDTRSWGSLGADQAD